MKVMTVLAVAAILIFAASVPVPTLSADDKPNRAGVYNSEVKQNVVGMHNVTTVYNYPPNQPLTIVSKKDRPPAPHGCVYADELPSTIFGTYMGNWYGYAPVPPTPPVIVPLPGQTYYGYTHVPVPVVVAPAQVVPSKVPPLCKKCKKPSCKHRRHAK